MGMWNELANYIKIPSCTCRKCECDVSGKVIQMMEEERTRQSLMGLDDNVYSTIRSQILTLDPLPPIDKIFNIIQQEENHKKVMIGRDTCNEHASAFAVKEQLVMNEKGTCKLSENTGTMAAIVMSLLVIQQTRATVGVEKAVEGVEAWRQSNRGRGRGAGRESGHCTVTETAAHTNSNIVMNQAAIPGLSSEQVQKLLSLIDTRKPSYETLTGKALWMLDSGASCHMMGDLNLIENVRDVRPIGVGLPDGKENMANKKGTVKLSKNLKLNNVLYTPDLRCNLISIAQVSRDLNCYVTFYDDICFL